MLKSDSIWGLRLSIFINLMLLSVELLLIRIFSPASIKKPDNILLCCATPMIGFLIVDSFNQINIFAYDIWTFGFNLLAYSAVGFILFFIIGNAKITSIILLSFSYLFGLVNHYVSLFRGTPLLPWDILSAKTAFSVASNYDFVIDMTIIAPTILFVLMMLVLFRIDAKQLSINRHIRQIIISRIGIFAVIGTFSFVTLLTNIPNQLGIIEFPWNQSNAYQANGSFLNFLLNTKYLMVDKPAEYSIEKVNEIAQSVSKSYEHKFYGASANSEQTITSAKRPNIIVIMNESFSDLSVLGDFGVSEDYLPFYRSLTENTIKGNTYVSVHGGNTCNSEFEMLTGSTTAFTPTGSIPYQQYIKQQTPALPSLLAPLHYSNAALHPYYASGWNRPQVYPLLGFEQFLTKDDWVNPQYIRSYISDQSDYQKIIELYEQKPAHENLFLFNITMQNHSGYTDKNYHSDIYLTDMQGNYPKTEQYLSLIKQSDQAFEQLITYFQGQSEPTIIMMFGDHQPAIEASFYEELLGKPTEDFSLEELQKKYITPFIIWANYDIEEQYIDKLSANYLSTLLLDTAGIQLPVYHQFLKQLSEVIPVINANGFIDKDNQHYTLDQSSPYDELIEEYQILQYNNLFDARHRVDEIFEIPLR